MYKIIRQHYKIQKFKLGSVRFLGGSMKAQIFKILVLGIGLFAVQPALAALDFLAEIGIHEGGDDLITINFIDGSSRDLQAGEFLSLAGGIAWDMGSIMEGRLTAGWKGDEVSATNGSVKLNRWTSDFMLFFKAGGWRFGGGAAYHWDVQLEGSGDASSASADFDNAAGAVAEIDYYFNENAYIGLQYLNIEYDRQATLNNSARTFDASSIGLIIGGRW